MLGLCLASTAQTARQKVDSRGKMYSTAAHAPMFYVHHQLEKASAQDLLGCPDSTVLGGEWTQDAAYTGFQCSDQGRPGMPMKFFQHFSGCVNTLTGVRVLGLFNYFDESTYNWLFCNDRAGIDTLGNMTIPVTFEVSFYKEDENGYPGEQVYTKTVDLLGENTYVQTGDESSGYQNIQAFNVALDDTLKMESGFLSFSAVDKKDSPSCWFSVFTTSSSMDYGLIKMDSDYQYAMNPMVFCLKGNGDLAAHKALKLAGVITPKGTATGKYERVEVQLENAGADDISDATLELWADGKRVATEKVNATIASLKSYKYTFKTRVDCSGVGEHHFTIKNVTPGDENLCAKELKFSTVKQAEGSLGASQGDNYAATCIEEVKYGTVDNTSEGTPYSDFTNLKANIMPGDTLHLKVVPASVYANMLGWIDWNGNGVLGETGEQINFNPVAYGDTACTADIVIPAGVDLEAGDKVMRLISSYDNSSSPVGSYSYGETEDYTVTVCRKPGSPALSNDVKVVDETTTGTKTVPLTLTNNGESALNATLSYEYILPGFPSTEATPVEAKPATFNMVMRRLPATKRAAEPEADASTKFTLHYDGGQYSEIGITNSDTATYAQLYPGSMVTNIEGMKIGSVDVYLPDVAKHSSIVIYGQKSQDANGEVLAEQDFEGVASTWNHIVLNNPVAIGSEDVWVGVRLSGFEANKYYMGIDNGSAVRGFGDIVNIGGDTWWSMADLGINANYCIRANVIGTPTPAISWLQLGTTGMDIAPGESGTCELNMDATKLADNQLYEAKVVLRSNDELRPTVRIPVYLSRPASDKVETVGQDGCKVVLSGNTLTVLSARKVMGLRLYSLSGQTVATASGNTLTASLQGAYLLEATLQDGSHVRAKVLLRK